MKRIKPKLVGHTWSANASVSPRIISVVKAVCEAGFVGGGGSMKWLLDYTLTPFGRFKVKSRGAPWKERHAFEAHLYPAGGYKFEDTGTAGVSQTESIYVTFVGGETAGLGPLVERMSYACFKDPSRRLVPLLERVLQIGLEYDDEGFWEAQGVLCEIIALLLRCRHVQERQGSGKDETYVVPEAGGRPRFSELAQGVRLYLREHLGERVTRLEVARHLHVSVSALAHRYRAETGESPMNTLARMRINLAKSLLFKGYRLKSIADQTGFCDEYHLSRTFKRVEGASPRAFRERHLLQDAGGP